MNFNKHSDLNGLHSFLSASKYAWIRYDDETLLKRLESSQAAQKGTELHAFAEKAITLGQKLGGPNTPLKLFVNDAIGFKMSSEVILYYSPWAFATTDAICFRKNILRIHDLKNGISKPSMDQLLIYAAYFCLEYEIRPADIETKLRIYRPGEVIEYEASVDEIVPIMDKVVWFDQLINNTLTIS